GASAALFLPREVVRTRTWEKPEPGRLRIFASSSTSFSVYFRSAKAGLVDCLTPMSSACFFPLGACAETDETRPTRTAAASTPRRNVVAVFTTISHAREIEDERLPPSTPRPRLRDGKTGIAASPPSLAVADTHLPAQRPDLAFHHAILHLEARPPAGGVGV